MKWSNVILALCAACGSSSSNTPTPNQVQMQTGQWEFVATPANGAKRVYVEANLAGTNAAIGSTVCNTALFQLGGTVGGQFCVNPQRAPRKKN